MADDQSLTVQINADVGNATDGMSRVATALDALIAKMPPLAEAGSVATAAVAEGHAHAASKAIEHAEAEEFLGGALGKVETGTNAMARAMGALGLQTGEASERVLGLTEALEGVGKAALPLLAVGAAALAVGEAFNFLKEGVEEAEKAQSTLASIGQAVKDQGGKWDEAAQGGVERFIDAIERATTYSRGEALEAINSLTSAGTSLADSEKIVAIATDVAAGSHRSLIEVVDKIKQAEAGRGRGLEELDEKLKPLIEHHAHLSVILRQLSEDMAGQASAALDTNAGKTKLLANEIEHLGEDIGAKLLPMVNAGLEALISFADVAENNEPRIAGFFDGVIHGAERAMGVLEAFAKIGAAAMAIGADIATGRLANVKTQFDTAHKAAEQGGYQLLGVGPTTNPFADAMAKADAGFKAERAAAEAEIDQIRKQALQSDPIVGGDPKPKREKKGYEAGSYDFTPEAIPTFDKDVNGDAQKSLEVNLKNATSGEAAYEEAVKSATSAAQQQNAEWALAEKQSADGRNEIELLSVAIGAETTKINALAAALPKQEAEAKSATETYNAFGKSLAEESERGVKPTKDQENALKDLKTAMEAAKTAASNSKAEIEKLNGYLEQNTTRLREATAAADTYTNKLAELARADAAFVDRSIRDLDEKLIAELEAEKKEEGIRANKLASIQTEVQLDALSLQQQLRFYQQRYANAVAAGQEMSDQAKSDFDKIVSLETEMYKERLDAQKQFIDGAQQLETTFLNTILTKHQSLRDSLKSIFGDIEADFVKMLEQMIVKSTVLNGLNAQLEKIFNVGGGSTTSPGGITGGSALGSIFGGGSGSSPSALGQDTPGSNPVFELGSTSVQSLTGSPTGVSSAFSSTGLAAPAGTTIFTGAGDASGLPVGPGNAAPSASFGTYAGGALTGIGIGQAVASVDGGNSTYSSIGGVIGSLAGIVSKANPLAGLGLDIGGAILGSLFTGNAPTAAKDPDQFESTTGYGQDVADLQFGQSGANGVAYYPDSAIAKFVASMNVGAGSITGAANQGQQSVNSNGTIASSGGIDAAEIWLSQNKGDTAAQLEQMGVSPAQFASWVSLLGSSATGSGQYSHIAGDPNVGDIEVTGAGTGGGTKTTTAALAAALQGVVTASGSSSSQTSPVFTVARTYPNMNLGTVSQTGTYDQITSGVNLPTVQGTTPIAPLPTAGTVTSGSTTVGTGTASSDAVARLGGLGNVNLTIQVTGDNVIAGASDMQDFANKIAQPVSIALRRLASGQLFGSAAAVAAARSGNLS